MPFYTWQGVDMAADWRRGVSFARSQVELESLLLGRDIALVTSRQARFLVLGRKVSLLQKIAFFKQSAVLLSSGLQIPKMLTTVIAQTSHIYFKEVLIAVCAYVQEGMSLSDAMAHYPQHFSAVMIRMVAVGETTGALAPAMHALSDYLESMASFKKKVRAALMLPLITLSFFFVMVLVMLLVVVPQFHDIFRSLDASLPWITSVMMSVSDALRSWWSLGVGMVLLVGLGMVMRKCSTTSQNRWVQKKIVRVPMLGSLMGNMTIVHTMHACGMMLEGGVHMIPALTITQFVISNSVVRDQFGTIIECTRTGVPFYQAMQQSGMPFAQDDIIAMLAVGQESGAMAHMMTRIADSYQEKVERMLEKITVLIQPLLMLVLGILIMTMVVAIYAPLFNMAHLV